MVAGLVGAWCFSLGIPHWEIMGALLLVACYTLDNCDGEIARLKGLSSEWGAHFDDLVDWLVDSAFFIGLGYGTWQAANEIYWFWFGLAAATGATIDYIIDLIMHARAKKNLKSKSREKQATEAHKPKDLTDRLIHIFHKLSRADFCFIVFGLSVFETTWVLLPLAAIGAQWYWMTDLLRKR